MKKQTKHQGNLTTLRVIKREDTKGEHCRKPPNIKTTEKKQPARTKKKGIWEMMYVIEITEIKNFSEGQ